MKVLLIGGTGAIASGIINSLKNQSAEITTFSRGKTPFNDSDVEKLKGDRNQEDVLKQIITKHEFDTVIDLIGDTPEQIQQLINIAEGHTKQIIFSSSVNTYGNHFLGKAIHPTDVQKPITLKGKNKFECERLLLEATLANKFELTILRLSNVYGANKLMPCNILFQSVAWDRILNEKPILTCSDGVNLMHITHLDDIGNAFSYACLNEKAFKKAYNVVYEKCLTWNQYYQEIAKGLEKDVNIIYAPKNDVLELSNGKFDPSLGQTFGFNAYYDSTSIYRDIPEFSKTIPISEGAPEVIKSEKAKGRLPKWDSNLMYNKIIEHFSES